MVENPLRNGRAFIFPDGTVGLSKSAESPELQELRKQYHAYGTTIQKLQKTGISRKKLNHTVIQLMTAEMKILIKSFSEQSPSATQDAERIFFAYGNPVANINIPLTRKRILTAYKSLAEQEKKDFFSALTQHGHLHFLILASNPDSIIAPPEMIRDMHEFLVIRDTPKFMERVKKQFQKAMNTQASEEAPIPVLEVDKLLPEETKSTKGKLSRKFKEVTDIETDESKTQPRLEWLLSALRERGFNNQDMILYREKTAESGKTKSHPYSVLEVKKGDQHFQIAFCAKLGYATYIIREPIDFKNGPIISLDELRNRDNVFQIACYNEKQFARNIHHYACSPIENIETQLKGRIKTWSDKKDSVLRTTDAFEKAVGVMFYCNDSSIIDVGPLAGETTPSRIYRALQAKAINGLEHIKTFTDLQKEAETYCKAALPIAKSVEPS